MSEKNTEKKSSASDAVGNAPEVNEKSLEVTNRVVGSVQDAIEICDTLVKDARILIKNARRITNKKNGARPYRQSILDEQGRKWQPNISSGAFGTELRRAAPRLYMPVLGASTLTAASLPVGWPEGEDRANFFREEVTTTIRSWKKWGMFCRGLAKECVDYGYTFACWTDQFQWQPHLVRMDQGFVPRGTQIMDEPLIFCLEWEYTVSELLELVKNAIKAGVDVWEKDSVAYAIEHADVPVPDNKNEKGARKWEEMIREQVNDYSYTKGFRVITARHLFVTESTGKISQYVLWPEGPEEHQLLCEKLDAYDNMSEVVVPLVFDFGDGSIHGSWGAGQMLFDVGDMLDKVRCDSIANLKLTNKVRLQVKDSSRAQDAKIIINSDCVIAEGGEFAQNIGGIGNQTDAFIALDAELVRWMQERIGAYLPPIPLGNSDIKAAQVNAVTKSNEELQRDVLEVWLMQFAYIISTITKRLLDKSNPDPAAKALRQKLLGEQAWYKTLFRSIKETVSNILGINTTNMPRLTEDELALLINQPAVQSVVDFTQFAASQRAQFAAAIKGDSRFDQIKAASLWAEGVPSGGQRLARYLVIQQGDTTLTVAAQRQQLMENSTMIFGQDVPVVATDAHYIHMQAMKQPLEQAIKASMLPAAQAGLRHLASHYAAGVAQKSIPPDQINAEKSYISTIEKAIQALEQQQQLKQLADAQAAMKSQIMAAGGGVAPAGTSPAGPPVPGAVAAGGLPGA